MFVFEDEKEDEDDSMVDDVQRQTILEGKIQKLKF